MSKSQKISKILKFPRILNIQYDYDFEESTSTLPFVVEKEIDLSGFGCKNYQNENHPKLANDFNDNSNSMNSSQSKVSTILESMKAAKTNVLINFGVNSQQEETFYDNGKPNENLNAKSNETFRYQLNSFSVYKCQINKKIFEIVSYIKIKEDWFEFSSKGACEVTNIEKIAQTCTGLPIFMSYSLIDGSQLSPAVQDLNSYLAHRENSELLDKKTFLIPDNFVNHICLIKGQTKLEIRDKFCLHDKLKPDYYDVVLTKKRYNFKSKTIQECEYFKLPSEIVKNADLIDGSFASLQYIANSTEVPLNLARKLINQELGVLESRPFDLENFNYFQVCKDCLTDRKNFTLRRALEKSLVFNFMKAKHNKGDRTYLVDIEWFRSYQTFLLPDIKIFRTNKRSTLEGEAPNVPFNIAIDQKLFEYHEKHQKDRKIADDHFIEVDERFHNFLQIIYKGENSLRLDKNSIVIERIDNANKHALFSDEEKFLIRKIENCIDENFEFDMFTQASLYELNKKLNILLEIAMESNFKQLFKGTDISNDVISNRIPQALKKFVKYFEKHQSDFLKFDPCKMIYSLFNKDDRLLESKCGMRKNFFFPATSQISSADKIGSIDLNNSIFYRSIQRSQQDKLNNLGQTSIHNSQKKNKESLIDHFQEKSNLNTNSPGSLIKEANSNTYELNYSVKDSFYAKDSSKCNVPETSIFYNNDIAESTVIKFMKQSTLERVYKNQGDKIAQFRSNDESSLDFINRSSVKTQSGRDSIASINSRLSKNFRRSLTKKNMHNLLKHANNMMALDQSINRDTIQLDDSFTEKFGNNSFFSQNVSNRDTFNEWVLDKGYNVGEERLSDLDNQRVSVLEELPTNENEEAVEKGTNEDFENEQSEPQSQDGSSKMLKKSRFCNPTNIKLIGENQSDDENFDGSYTSEDDNINLQDNHNKNDKKTENQEEIQKMETDKYINRENNEFENAVLKNGKIEYLNSPQAKSKTTINEIKNEDSKQEFFLMIVKEKKKPEEQKVINLSFDNQSLNSNLEVEKSHKKLVSQSFEGSMSKSRIIESIKEENSENEQEEELKDSVRNQKNEEGDQKEESNDKVNIGPKEHPPRTDNSNKVHIHSTKKGKKKKSRAKGKENASGEPHIS
jgi:hypothetical protein